MSSPHSGLTGTNLHVPFHYIQDADPGAVGAGRFWLDTNSGPPLKLYRRNAGDSGWDEIGPTSAGAALTVQEIDGAPLDAAVTVIRVTNGKLTDNGAGDVTLDLSGSGSALTVQEIDGTPSDTAVTVIKVSNGTLTDNGAGDVTINTKPEHDHSGSAEGGSVLTEPSIIDPWIEGAIHLPEQSPAPGTPPTGYVVLYPKTDGLLYQKDDAGTETVLAGGGSSSTVYTNALASPPGSPANGDWWLPSDSMGLVYARVSGAWVPRGPLFPMVDPTAISMAWITQGSATITDRGGLHLSAPAAAAFSLRIRKWAAPATPWTYTFHARPLTNGRSTVDAGVAGMGFRQSSDGKLHVLGLWPRHSAVGYVTSSKFATATSFSAHYVGPSEGVSFPIPDWFQLSDDGTNRILRYGYDGQNWIDYHSIGRTDFLTADEICIFASAPDTTYTMGLTVTSIRQS
jgi:hypothetical protein